MATRDGYCEHGTYVGGCGVDHMCGWCESGVSVEDMPKPIMQDCDGCWMPHDHRVLTHIRYVGILRVEQPDTRNKYVCDECVPSYLGTGRWMVR